MAVAHLHPRIKQIKKESARKQFINTYLDSYFMGEPPAKKLKISKCTESLVAGMPRRPTKHTETEASLVSDFCVAPCAELGKHLTWPRMRSHPGPMQNGTQMTTWFPDKGLFCRMGRLDDERTVIEVGEQFYYMPAEMCMASVDEDAVVYAQYTQDYVGEHRKPRLLVYDIWTPQTASHTPEQRYALLLEKFPSMFQSARKHIVLQWVGHCDAAKELIETDPGYGHKIGGLFHLTNEPHVTVRPLRISIPPTRPMNFGRRP